jgi:hypothetical protein
VSCFSLVSDKAAPKKQRGFRMKGKIFLVLTGLILALHGCAKTVKMTPVTSSDQKAGYDGTITSQKKHFISLSPYSELNVAKDKTMFLLAVQNLGEVPLNISNDSISVIFEGNTENWASKRINVQSLDDFIDDLKIEYGNKEREFINSELEDIRIKLLMVSSSSSSSSSGSSSSSFSGSGSSSSSSSGSSSSSSDSESVETLIEDLNYDIDSMRSSNQLLRESLKEIVMKPQTIMPDNSFSGIVVFDTREMDKDIEGNFQIAVLVDSETHNFTFKRGLNK